MGNSSSTEQDKLTFSIVPEVLIPENDEILHQLQISLLTDLFKRKQSGEEAVFCTTEVTYYQQRTSWTCSYASTQMIISALLKQDRIYRNTLFDGVAFVPDVLSIQQLIEQAWKLGYDVEGSNHFKQKLAGKSMRIGVSDIAALFRANKVPSSIYDFDEGHNSWSMVLSFWFSTHTIVIVGCTYIPSSSKVELLCFDPIINERQAKENLKSSSLKSLSAFKVNANNMLKIQQFQILLVGPPNEGDNLVSDPNKPDVKSSGKVLYGIRPELKLGS